MGVTIEETYELMAREMSEHEGAISAVIDLLKERDEVRGQRDSLLAACKIGLAYIENGDWANGNVAPCSSIDEGCVRAEQAAEQIRAAIAKGEAVPQ